MTSAFGIGSFAVATARIPGFLPSGNGFRFANDWPHVPMLEFKVPTGRELRIGDAAGGMCGGMVFAVRDLVEHGLATPPDTAPPERGTPLFEYLVKRAFDSFDIPGGPTKYYAWMALPEGDLPWVRGLTWRSMSQEWPRVRADLDAGTLPPLGLVRTRSYNPMDLGLNHQVLAFGYDLDEVTGAVRILVYDPNHPGEDSIALETNTSGHAPIAYVAGETLVRGFFRSRFRPVDPSGLSSPPP